MSLVSKITLGTAQLGMRYGTVRSSEPPGESGPFLGAAFAAGITSFDTARLYGDSEERIGDWLANTGAEPFLVTKFPPLRSEDNRENLMTLETALAQSRAALRGQEAGAGRWADIVLAHRADDILLSGVADFMRRERDEGRIGAFGVSTYTPEQLEAALTVPDLAAVQVPFSIFDTRLLEQGLLEECRRRGVLVFARSLFLQGVLFEEPLSLPDHLNALREPLRALNALSTSSGRSLAALAFGALAALPEVSSLVVGMSHLSHIEENMHALAEAPDGDLAAEARALFKGMPEEVVDPRRWPK